MGLSRGIKRKYGLSIYNQPHENSITRESLLTLISEPSEALPNSNLRSTAVVELPQDDPALMQAFFQVLEESLLCIVAALRAQVGRNPGSPIRGLLTTATNLGMLHSTYCSFFVLGNALLRSKYG